MTLKIGKLIDSAVMQRDGFPMGSDVYEFEIVDHAIYKWGRVVCRNGLLVLYLMVDAMKRYPMKVYECEMTLDMMMKLAGDQFGVDWTTDPNFKELTSDQIEAM